MEMTGGCHCGAIRYAVQGELIAHVLCHCTDCRRSAGAPMVGWAMYSSEALRVLQGAAKVYVSSEHGRRHFCGDCGTGLFYTNDVTIPGIMDVQSATFDNPGAVAAACHTQVAERIGWMAEAHRLPVFERYPPMG